MFASRFGRLRTLVVLAAVGLASVTLVTTAQARVRLTQADGRARGMARLRTRRAGTGSSTGCAVNGYPVCAAPGSVAGTAAPRRHRPRVYRQHPGPEDPGLATPYGGAVITQAASGGIPNQGTRLRRGVRPDSR